MQAVSGLGPFGGDDPFGGMSAMFNQILGAFGGDPAQGWAHAKQLGAAIANEGESESNVDPVDRLGLDELARIAEMHITEATGLTVPTGGHGVTVAAVNRSQWVDATLDAYRPLFEQLTGSLGSMMREQLADVQPEDLEAMGATFGSTDPRAFLDGLSRMLGPVMLSMMAGSTVGHLVHRGFGSYPLPITRPANEPVLIVVDNVDAFGRSWSIPTADLRLAVCIEELTHRAVLGVPHVRARIDDLLARHASGFTADAAGLEDRLGVIDMESPDGFTALQDLLSDPDVVLGAIRSPAQQEVLPHLDSVITVVEGYADWVLDTVGARLLGNVGQLAEALRRRRIETDQASRFVERLFGLELTQDTLDRGGAFIGGVVERAGADVLGRLWTDAAHLPTPAELDAPGLWLARMGDDHSLPDLPDDTEIPDFPDLES